MIKGGIGGGNTITGLLFEGERDILKLFEVTLGYEVKPAKIGVEILYEKDTVAKCFKKYDFYRFLESEGVDWKSLVSARLEPDSALYVIHNNTLFVIELKFQNGTGSVDEKLQTCDYKLKQYKKLLYQLNIEVEYIYILSDWFKKPRYKDSLDYVISVGCQFYFGYLPLHKLGLPVPD